MRARDVMTSPVITVTPDTPADAAAMLLVSHGFTALPVVDPDDRLIGIVTEADVIRDRFSRDSASARGIVPAEAERDRPRALTVGEVMTVPVSAMGPGTDAVDLVDVMLEARIRAVPIVDGSTLIGIVTRRDLVRRLAWHEVQALI